MCHMIITFSVDSGDPTTYIFCAMNYSPLSRMVMIEFLVATV